MMNIYEESTLNFWICVIKTDEILLKKNRYEFSSAFIDQRLPNMVQRLFADVIHDANWLMNIHEQKYPWFLAMKTIKFIFVASPLSTQH